LKFGSGGNCAKAKIDPAVTHSVDAATSNRAFFMGSLLPLDHGISRQTSKGETQVPGGKHHAGKAKVTEKREPAVRRSAIVALAALSLIASGIALRDSLAAQNIPALSDLTSFQLLRVDSGAPSAVTADQAADVLKNFDVVFIGEWHDHTGNHVAEMA